MSQSAVAVTPAGDYYDVIATLRKRYASLSCGTGVPCFAVMLPDRSTYLLGRGKPSFTVDVTDHSGLRALSSFDELALAEAYMDGHIDIAGSMLDSLKLRGMLSDRRPLQYLFATYLQPRGESHYDVDPKFFESWLDPKTRGYSLGFFESDDEPLESALERKFRYAMTACRIEPGMHVLDIGGGLGSFSEFAGAQGVRVTSLTLSVASETYMKELIARLNLPCRVVREHFLEHRSAEPYDGTYDAIVNFSASEHLLDYRRTVENYERLLKWGGRVYLDACSGARFGMPSFITKWVHEGDAAPLFLAKFLAELDRTQLQVIESEDRRHHFFLTCQKWAQNLEAARAEIVTSWGQHPYRRFRLYLWAAANAFETATLGAHYVVLQKPHAR